MEQTGWETIHEFSDDWSNTSVDEITSGQQQSVAQNDSQDNNEDKEYVDKKWTRIYEGANDAMHMTIIWTTANQLHKTHNKLAGRINLTQSEYTNREIVIQVVSNQEEGVTADMMQQGMSC